jgi:L-cysteine/cystine lyase
LVSFRVEGIEPEELVERLRTVDVQVRELPGRGLVRASVGWWNDEHDLDRLVAGIRG